MMEQIHLTPEQIRKLQMEFLDLLLEVDRICQKHHIRYFLSSGTLLGAVRHHGFIPWDDDADVEMFREDYERFCAICSQELDPKKFFLQTTDTDSGYNWPFGKLRKKNTRYVRVGQSHLPQKDGLCIDLFVMDPMSENHWAQQAMRLGSRLCRKVLWSPVGAVRLKNPVERCWFKLLRLIPRSAALALFRWITGWYRHAETPCYGFFVDEAPCTQRGYAYYKEWYAETLRVDFEGHMLPIPSGYDHILYVKYNDYMKFPAPEDRHGNVAAEYIQFSDGTELRV